MGPPELAAAARRLARRHRAQYQAIIGRDLLRRNYPAIHAIGRAAAKAPRLIDLRWGRRDAPKVTLVGKGVCFDTGGLDLKLAPNMKLMKKDMGGAAHVLGLADMIMAAGLDVRLRVLVPAVENGVAGNAIYPLDVVTSRSGRTIEIGHTDAEGRVILADALTEACRETPDLVVDFATLTGAARVALGVEVAAMFSNDDGLAEAISASGRQAGDPVWRLPLWQPYADYNKSAVADISNEPSHRQGGAIAAALFLESFVGAGIPWVHFDIMAWNLYDRPGRPKGGEAMGLRAMFGAIAERFGGRRAAARRTKG
jgi:leucyl aminopeptidase